MQKKSCQIVIFRLKTAILNQYVSLRVLLSYNISKQIEIPYVLTILLSIPLNKLPCP